jgi:VanZ family protein
MVPSGNRWANRIAVRAPVILLVLAATAIPVEWRPQGQNALDFNIEAFDLLANVAAYLVVGFVLGDLGWQKAILIAAVMSTFAESIQLVMMHRDPSAIDLTSNVIGAILGTVVSARWRIRAIGFGINRLRAMAAATLAVALVFGVSKTSGNRLSDHGAGSPGTLEAYWRLDESDGRVAEDASGHGLNGTFSHAPVRVAGAIGRAAKFDGETDYIDFGHSTAFRLVGSMTVSAWIKSTSYPIDDAAIVSSFHHSSGPLGSDVRGFQLDTTVDNGPRTVGFKLANVCGNIVARYGATPLRLDTWYHVAGVYDAEEQTMTVYLNGKPDNGVLLESVTSVHRSSREPVYAGRRPDWKGFEFAGLIDEVRVYSVALTDAEIAGVMQGGDVAAVRRALITDTDSGRDAWRKQDRYAACTWVSEHEDARIPGAVAMFGVLLAVACVGLWPSAHPMLSLLVSFLGGSVLFHFAASTLPSSNLWMFSLTSLAGGVSVAVSVRHEYGSTLV